MKPYFASLVVIWTTFACGSSSPDPTSDAYASPSPEAGTSKPPLDPTCRSQNGCALYGCKCLRSNGVTAAGVERSDQLNGTCLSGEEVCKKYCDSYEMAIDGPVQCDPIVEGPPVDASAPEQGRPGGACNPIGEKCLVMMCTCNDGTTRSPVSAPCTNGVCGGLAEACPFACKDYGGWGGKGTP